MIDKIRRCRAGTVLPSGVGTAWTYWAVLAHREDETGWQVVGWIDRNQYGFEAFATDDVISIRTRGQAVTGVPLGRHDRCSAAESAVAGWAMLRPQRLGLDH